MFTYALLVGGCATVLGIGLYFFTMAMSRTTKGTIVTVIRATEVESKRKQIREQLIEFLEFHSKVKQLSEI